MLAVPTPLVEDCIGGECSYTPEMKYVLSAAESIIPYLKEGNLVILESTSPVGSTEKVAECIFFRQDQS